MLRAQLVSCFGVYVYFVQRANKGFFIVFCDSCLQQATEPINMEQNSFLPRVQFSSTLRTCVLAWSSLCLLLPFVNVVRHL